MDFALLCDLDGDRLAEREQRRDDHLRHVGANRDRIGFGGIVYDGSGEPAAIHYYLRDVSAADAQRFVEDDPYFPFYRSVRILPFNQRLPDPSEVSSKAPTT